MNGSDRAGHPTDRLSAYLDGELPPGEKAAVEHHIQGCLPCQAELEQVGQVRQLLRRLPEPEPPFGLIERLILRPRRRMLPVAWAAGAAAALVLGVMASGTTHTQAPTVDRLVEVHATSTGRDPVSGLAPVAVPVSFAP